MVVWPNGSTTVPRVSSEFGPRPAPIAGASTMHKGIDLYGWKVVKAPWAGKVILARYNGGAGNAVHIQSANGDVAKLFHNAAFYVSEGQMVAEGQDVALMGTTGTSTGIHCHFETWGGGGTVVLNPRIYMAMAMTPQPARLPKPKPDPIIEPKEDPMLFLRSIGSGEYAQAGFIYRRDEKTGAWRVVSNLEGNILVPKLVAAGAVLHDFEPNELEIMFGTDGLLEQHPVPVDDWGGADTPLRGLGAPTGRVIFPGAPDPLGSWH